MSPYARLFSVGTLALLPLRLPAVWGLSTSSSFATMTRANPKNNLWSDADIEGIKELSLSQKEKLLAVEGLFDKKRPVSIQAQALGTDAPEAWMRTSSSDGSTNSKKVVSKIIHFQRHGQGYHNILGYIMRDLGVKPDIHSDDPTVNPWLRPEIVDSPLTELGKEQCAAQREQASLLTPQVVIVSPMLRALQTAKISFTDHDIDRSQIPWVAHEGCREDLGVLVCNQRRKKSTIQAEFPDIELSDDMPEEDSLWHPTKRESPEALSDRIYDFLVHFVAEREEEEIAVIGHSFWLFNMCTVVNFGGDYDLEKWFLTSEIRSMRLTFTYE